MAHIHEKIDFTASVFIVRDGKVLLHKHKRLGIWLQPGGHIELDEDPVQAVLREAKEETGLEIELVGEQPQQFETIYNTRVLMTPRFMNRHFFDADHTHEHVDLVYFARAKAGEPVAEEDAAPVRWMSKEELTDPALDILPDVQFYALAALKELS